MALSTVALTLCTIILGATAQIPQQYTHNPCASKSTCHDCIRTPSCAWCYDPAINATVRCFQPSYPQVPLDQCNPDFIYNPDNVMQFLQDHAVSTRRGGAFSAGGSYEVYMNSSSSSSSSSYSGGSGEGYEGSITQIRPQRISLRLRAKEVYRIRMEYSQAEDYPVDLYYLMDLSKSMEDDKEKLSALGERLTKTMTRMTSKFMLGFGSFVDKVVMPYVSTIPEKLRHPCIGCVAPYGFRNHMTLSTNTKTFSEMVKQASVSGNLDAPEGGFDAIMQAVVCRGQIGWREKARRLLVFSTDAGFHYAGDGKLGGIVKPNDGKCHLDNRGYYTMSSQQDYPSISQINTYVKQNSINVIFAVTADKVGIYKQLATHIEGSTCGQLSNDSSNVVELIKEQYKAISSSIEMKHNASSDIKIKFFSKCLGGKESETNKCSDIKVGVGSLVEFRVELQIVECPKDERDWKQIIQIYPVGINESLTIDLTMICDCPCERRSGPFFREKAPECKSAGTFMCGVCACDENAYGPHCECNKDETNTNVTTAGCINPKTGLECSGKGTCVCGQCECEPRSTPTELIYGDQCECDNFSCERHNNEVCSGKDHGECECGTCVCKQGWTGSNCACRNETGMCIPDTNKNNATNRNETTVCSGHGICDCGICKCDKGFYGPYCEHDYNTTDECLKYKPCVQCRLYKTGPYKTDKECISNPVCNFHIIEEDVVVANESNKEIFCPYYEEDCRFAFVFYYNETNQVEVRAQRELKCKAVVFLLGVVLGVIAAVVLMGLAILLLWKLLTTIHDRREFAKFEKETMMARWDTGENPIYKQATSTFKNPTYAGKS